MTTKNVKNLSVLLGGMTAMICTTATPHMVKWMLSIYVIMLIAEWMGNDEDTTRQGSIFFCHSYYAFYILDILLQQSYNIIKDKEE